MAKKKKPEPEKTVDMERVAEALAHTVATGDIVNFRAMFIAYSPTRTNSSEILDVFIVLIYRI